jgi:VIT1/CCC1 family predicted Fe2+/Mn2+ transporter
VLFRSVASLTLSGFALALIGAGSSLFTARNVVFTSVRSLLLGFAAAAITYGVGRLVGVTLA